MLLIFVLFLCNISYSEQHGRYGVFSFSHSFHTDFLGWWSLLPDLQCGGLAFQHQRSGLEEVNIDLWEVNCDSYHKFSFQIEFACNNYGILRRGSRCNNWFEISFTEWEWQCSLLRRFWSSTSTQWWEVWDLRWPLGCFSQVFCFNAAI